MSPGLCSITFIVIKLLWLSLVSCNASLGKSFIGKLILKILCWWICLTFWVFVKSICALVVWDFSYVMVVVCCLILIIVLVVIATGEWKEHGFVVQAGRRMAYKGTNWVEAYSYIGILNLSVKKMGSISCTSRTERICVCLFPSKKSEWMNRYTWKPIVKKPFVKTERSSSSLSTSTCVQRRILETITIVEKTLRQ